MITVHKRYGRTDRHTDVQTTCNLINCTVYSMSVYTAQTLVQSTSWLMRVSQSSWTPIVHTAGFLSELLCSVKMELSSQVRLKHIPYILRTAIIGLHFAADNIGVPSLKSFWWGHTFCLFLQEWRFWRSRSSKVIHVNTSATANSDSVLPIFEV